MSNDDLEFLLDVISGATFIIIGLEGLQTWKHQIRRNTRPLFLDQLSNVVKKFDSVGKQIIDTYKNNSSMYGPFNTQSVDKDVYYSRCSLYKIYEELEYSDKRSLSKDMNFIDKMIYLYGELASEYESYVEDENGNREFIRRSTEDVTRLVNEICNDMNKILTKWRRKFNYIDPKFIS